ncbi:MAG: hypothetical protein E2O56_04445 [Gammaproteobacteria bacterium]|nr:MAG: hypothetical protein E2O56_04445 [Gammaproteobacteria bacterium]
MSFDEINCFTTTVWVRQAPDHDKLNQDLVENIRRLQKSDPKGELKSNILGWQSKRNLHTLAEFSVLTEIIGESLIKLARQLMIRKGMAWTFDMWVNLSPAQAYNMPHIHSESHISGVYYVRVPPGSSSIFFRDPRVQSRILKLPVEKESPLHASKLFVQPEEGKMYLFPSWLEHGVMAGENETDRISIAFNARAFKRPVG